MKLAQPFKGYFPISQGFGENLNGYYKADGLKGHQGMDIAMPTGTPIISPMDGTVVAISLDIQRGEGVSVMSDNIYEYKGKECKFICVHWHLKDKSIVVKIGDKVKVGDLLGLSNNTGQSTGPHLHFSIMPIATDGSRKSLAGLNNGYNGCIDPMPYLELEPKPVVLPVLKIGSKGEDVKKLQTKLGVKVDGIFGKWTKLAIQGFQLKNHLIADGVVGKDTYKALNK